MAIEIVVFWDVMPCSLVWMNQCFGRTHCFQLQNRRDLPYWCWRQQAPPKHCI